MSQSVDLSLDKGPRTINSAVGPLASATEFPQQSLPALPIVDLRVKPARGLWGNAWLQFRKHKLAMAGLVMFIIMVLATFIGSPLYPQKIDAIDFSVSGSAMTREHPMGTDSLGQDILGPHSLGRAHLALGRHCCRAGRDHRRHRNRLTRRLLRRRARRGH